MGFEFLEYPSLNFKTPQTLYDYKIRCLSVKNELTLKGSLIDPNKVDDLLSKILFESIIEKPDTIITLEDWKKNTTVVDKKAFIYYLYYASYGDKYILSNTCPNCKTNLTSEVSLLNGFQATYFEGQPGEILTKIIDVPLPITGYIAKIKIPTIEMSEIINNALINQDDMLQTYLMVIDSFVDPHDNSVINTISQPIDSLTVLKMLPSMDRVKISEAFSDNFNKYDVGAKYRITCTNCGNKFLTEVDFLEQLFRMVQG